MRHFLLIFLFCSGFARANPIIVLQEAYISYEQLVVEISPSEARFRGTFRFSFSGAEPLPEYKLKARNFGAWVQVPVWFPLHSENNTLVTRFWDAFQMSGNNRITPENVRIFDDAVGFRVVVGRQPSRGDGWFSAFPGTDDVLPMLDPEPGFCRLWFNAEIPGDKIRRQVTISYRQPLAQTNGQARFFYTPIFLNLPKGVSTASARSHFIRLTASPSCRLTGANGEDVFSLAAGRSILLHPRHLQSIWAIVEPVANYPAAASSAMKPVRQIGDQRRGVAGRDH